MAGWPLLLLSVGGAVADKCVDRSKSCPAWAKAGECDKNRLFMSDSCKLSCGLCPGCTDSERSCPTWAKDGECEKNRKYMSESCRLSCGLCNAGSGVSAADGLRRHEACAATGDPECVAADRDLTACTDERSECAYWAVDGQCEVNPTYMNSGCAASCYQCESVGCRDLDRDCPQRAAAGECRRNVAEMVATCAFSCRACNLENTEACRRDPALAPAAVSGTIDATFRSLVDSGRAEVLSREPWIVRFADFLTDAEVDAIVAAGGHKFERSRATGDDDPSTPRSAYARTSSTSWCNVEACLTDPTFIDVRDRISQLTGVRWQNAEHLQLLQVRSVRLPGRAPAAAAGPRALPCGCLRRGPNRHADGAPLQYTEGQYYTEHHDQIAPRHSVWGPRLYTFFIYLSDVEEGCAAQQP